MRWFLAAWLALHVAGPASAAAGRKSATAQPKRKVSGKERKMITQKIVKTDAEWKALLTPEQFSILRKKGTERAFAGKYHDFKQKGNFVCAACGAPLFRSDEKFDSGTGWPSFWNPIEPGAVGTEEDRSLFMKRTEVHCDACGGHLGHVFDDGPPPTGRRYCINSAALKFTPGTPENSKK